MSVDEACVLPHIGRKLAMEPMAHRDSFEFVPCTDGYPRFSAATFWNFSVACELVGARYPAAPLGLITVAALLPQHWDIRARQSQHRGAERADLAWADLVMTGGMMTQQPDTPAPHRALPRGMASRWSSAGPTRRRVPHIYASADFLVLGEAEGIIDDFVAAWEARRAVRRVQRGKIPGRCHQDADCRASIC